MLPPTYLLHGFNVRDSGKSTTDQLIQPLQDNGHLTIDLDYGFWLLARVRLCNAPLAAVIARMAMPNCALIGHSNGCTIAWLAAQAGAPAERLILINPALDSNAAFPSLIGRIDVYYSPSDRPTWLAQWLPGNPWGAMGHTGYLGKDPRVTSHNLENILFRHVGHSDALHEPAFHNHLIGLFED